MSTGPASLAAVAFWQTQRPDNRLSLLRRICLASQVRQGCAVTLYSYAPVPDLPAGVVNADAGLVMPEAFRARLARFRTRGDIDHRATIQFSDLFRYRALQMKLGVWLDTDLFLVRPLALNPSLPYFAWESFFQIGNSVLYLPADHPIVALYEELMAQEDLITAWMPLRHRLKARLWTLFGRDFTPSDLSLSLFGPSALTRLARRTGAARHALPRRSFYAVHTRHERFFEPWNFAPLLADPQVRGFHVSPKRREHDRPAPGSLYEWAARNVGML